VVRDGRETSGNARIELLSPTTQSYKTGLTRRSVQSVPVMSWLQRTSDLEFTVCAFSASKSRLGRTTVNTTLATDYDKKRNWEMLTVTTLG
jgi:hypothetical protein